MERKILCLLIASLIIVAMLPLSAHAQKSNLQPVVYVPITITNTQDIATPGPFQVMILVNSTAYATYEAPDLSNIAFTYPNGTIIPSWLALGNSNSSTNTVYWLKTDGIAANSFLTINMTFYPTTDNVLNNVTTGEAPSLSLNYGEYDNGANVFIVYADFLSGMCGWEPNSFAGSFTPTPTLNGLELISNGGETTYLTSPVTLPLIPLQIEEGWNLTDGRNMGYAISAFGSPPYGTSSVISANVQSNGGPAPLVLANSIAMVWNEEWGGHGWLEESNNIVASDGEPGPGSIVSSLAINGTWASSGYSTTDVGIGSFGYAPVVSTMSGNILNPFVSGNTGLMISGNCGYSCTEYIRWIVASAFPPNDVIPSVSFGNVAVAPIITTPEFASPILLVFALFAASAVIVYRKKYNVRHTTS
jgi:hypothetical protein